MALFGPDKLTCLVALAVDLMLADKARYVHLCSPKSISQATRYCITLPATFAASCSLSHKDARTRVSSKPDQPPSYNRRKIP